MRESEIEAKPIPTEISFKSVGVVDETGTLIGEADICDHPKDIEPMDWFTKIQLHTQDEKAICIGIANGDKLIIIDQPDLQKIGDPENPNNRFSVLKLVNKARKATTVMLARYHNPNFS